MSSEKQYIDLYCENRELIDAHSAPAMNALREDALAAFQTLGFPSRKMERYKYTDVATVFAPDYGVNLKRFGFPVNPYDVFRCGVPNLSTSLYFMVNDQFADKASTRPHLPDGVVIDSLCKVAKEQPELVNKYYGTLARARKDSINALNTMLAQDGLLIYVPKGVVVERTIQVVNILRAEMDLMVNRRVLIVLEEGAQAKILFCDHSMDGHEFLTTQVSEVYVGENAHLELYELEETHTRNKRFANMYVDEKRNASATIDSITLNNGLTRNRTDVSLSGEYAEVNMYGCVVADGEQHVDNNTLIDHQAANCQSTELYKYVLDDKAVGAFAGRVLVREGAQKTVSQETNANLCATKTARMFSQPMLEIYADDVKCSHGSTVGQINDAALFYMRQRGIPEEEARLLLKFAFVGEVLDSIKLDALRDRLHFLVEQRFRGELGKCSGCGPNACSTR
ncbi:MAG: Fe-S cluster assembly protein SufD [Bacteroidaceae bacterium]|nr:Fe-S cluster assembly protein SufD [Bacteroidaceae bacterium]